jgi:protein tyrosine/serine phosphatase
MRNILFIVLFSVSPSLFAADGTPAIKNFAKVDGAPIYRGGRPKPLELFDLIGYNVKTIINLQGGDLWNAKYRGFMKWWEPGEDDKAISGEKSMSEEMQFKFFNVPLDSIDPVTAEEDAAVDQILGLMNNPALQPIYIHCEHGVDRTGLLIALYEVKFLGKSPAEAHDEWRDSGHKGVGAYFTGYLDEYYWKKVTTLAGGDHIPSPLRYARAGSSAADQTQRHPNNR